MGTAVKRAAKPFERRSARAALSIAVGALVLRVIAGVGFANYDTLYALAWGGQLSRGSTPAYDVPIAPTPHPLLELLGLVLAPLGPHAVENVTVALGFLALSACGWVIYKLGAEWFGWAAGALAALIFLTRAEVLSYGVRAYVDLAVLAARPQRPARRVPPPASGSARARVARARRTAAPGGVGVLGDVLALSDGSHARVPAQAPARQRVGRARHRLAAAHASRRRAPDSARCSRAAVVGAQRPHDHRQPAVVADATRSTPRRYLDRVTGIANVPEYIPRRIGEILRPPVLLGAALGGVLSLLWLRRRALLGALAGVVAVIVFAAFATIGLPINTRYAFLAAAILCIFCGAGAFGWMRLQRGDRRRRWWMAGGALVVAALIAYAPSEYRSAHRELDKLARTHTIEDELVALVGNHAINLHCGPVGVSNHAPVPLLSLYLKTSPRNIVSPEAGHIASGVYVDPASKEVEEDYVLDARDPVERVTVPPGFSESATQPVLADLPALCMRVDRAPLVETHGTRRRSPLATPVRELPLRLSVIA